MTETKESIESKNIHYYIDKLLDKVVDGMENVLSGDALQHAQGEFLVHTMFNRDKFIRPEITDDELSTELHTIIYGSKEEAANAANKLREYEKTEITTETQVQVDNEKVSNEPPGTDGTHEEQRSNPPYTVGQSSWEDWARVTAGIPTEFLIQFGKILGVTDRNSYPFEPEYVDARERVRPEMVRLEGAVKGLALGYAREMNILDEPTIISLANKNIEKVNQYLPKNRQSKKIEIN